MFGALGTFVRGAALDVVGRQHIKPVPTNQNRDDLVALKNLVEDGKITPVIGRTYPLADVVDALRQVEDGHAEGKVVLTVA